MITWIDQKVESVLMGERSFLVGCDELPVSVLKVLFLTLKNGPVG